MGRYRRKRMSPYLHITTIGLQLNAVTLRFTQSLPNRMEKLAFGLFSITRKLTNPLSPPQLGQMVCRHLGLPYAKSHVPG